jgi:hypothetical protein
MFAERFFENFRPIPQNAQAKSFNEKGPARGKKALFQILKARLLSG